MSLLLLRHCPPNRQTTNRLKLFISRSTTKTRTYIYLPCNAAVNVTLCFGASKLSELTHLVRRLRLPAASSAATHASARLSRSTPPQALAGARRSGLSAGTRLCTARPPYPRSPVGFAPKLSDMANGRNGLAPSPTIGKEAVIASQAGSGSTGVRDKSNGTPRVMSPGLKAVGAEELGVVTDGSCIGSLPCNFLCCSGTLYILCLRVRA